MSIVKKSKRTIRQQCETCGSNQLYWGQDGNKWVLIDANPTTQAIRYNGHVSERYLHEHQPDSKVTHTGHAGYKPAGAVKTHKADEAKATVAEVEAELVPDPWEPEVKVKPEIPVQTNGHNAEMEGLLEMLRKLLGQPQIDAKEVERIARDVIKDIAFPTKTVVVDPAGKTVKEIKGHTHAMLEKVIRAAKERHVFLVGPAGTGKSTIAEQVAEALDLEFSSISLTQQTPEIALRGFVDANGKYHRPAFLDRFEKGGIMCIDEVDHGHPNTVGVMNAALSNGQMSFPGYNNGKPVKRHKDFRVIATANTFGRGASREYVGATQLDAASIDRFAFVSIDIDDALEASMVGATGVDGTTQAMILEFVRQLRRNRESTGARIVISPRASVGVAHFLNNGFTFDEAVEMNIRKGASDDVWAKLTA